ncbi:MAG: primosomal protein N' [Planctomycetaceae bacterium]
MSRESEPRLFSVEPLLPFEAAALDDRLTAQVVVNRPLTSVFDYTVPEALADWIAPGCRVRVPFGRGNQQLVGYCVGLTRGVPQRRKLKEVVELIDREPLVSSMMLELTHWMSERYLCGWGQVIESVVPAGVKRQAGTREITCYALADNVNETLATRKLSKKQRLLIDFLSEAKEPQTVESLTTAGDCGTSPIHALVKSGLLVPIRRRVQRDEIDAKSILPQADLQLSGDQREALDKINGSLREQQHQTILLHGVTGSGKTEVYIQAIREVVSYGRQAIVLVPEISLTPQTIRRFSARFSNVAVLHSHLKDAERHWHWQRIASGEVQVVVGARSAVFAPLPQLGLIIIDEEHESTFKQQTTPRYHAREVARERCRIEKVPLVLGSATPTLESLERAQRGVDLLVSLPKRIENRPLPPVFLVDIRNDPLIARGHSIGRSLERAMRMALDEKGQIILFLNLRGYSTVVWCPSCRGGVKCPDCDITLTWHRDRQLLMCHSCEYASGPVQQCPVCDKPGVKYIGSGTQRLEQEVKTKFPGVSLMRMDSDSMRQPGSHDVALEAFRRGEIRILLGTQMIAKGLDFPAVTLVGVIDADTQLHQPDLRASERTFQLIAQVAGRTGRGDRPGRVLVQTMNPDEPVIQHASRHDYLAFAREELKHRLEMHSPPFAKLARIILRGLDESTVQLQARELAQLIREQSTALASGVRVLGPAPAQILKLRKHFRYHMLLSAAELSQLESLWHSVVPLINLRPDIEMQIDVDPMDMR